MFEIMGPPQSDFLTRSLELTLVNWFQLDLFDLLFVITAVVFNLQITGVYLAGKQKRLDLVKRFGAVMLSLTLPLAIVYLYYLAVGRATWITIAFIFIFLYMFVELLFDFILKIDFRKEPALHIPYIILFYIVEFVFIAVAFSINATSGYLVSISFWILLAALIYSFWPQMKERFSSQ
ncbi:MAG: hypothetical protein GWP61_16480 [Chloroflexi bacterium]|jgi:hypothetical protein|nr:hypothetical protein [Chloroflexota bacterium]